IDPFFAARYGQLALYNFALGKNAEAKANVLKDLDQNPADFSAWILLARLYQMENNRPGVVNALTKAFGLNSNLPQLKYLLFLAKNLPKLDQLPIQISVREPAL
ncbi:MAG TPA: hypothetical protein VE973_00720, partial [Candidatus Limnocylindria bacterium]|nr:hypothetical protein [Candidatus Limnocylindria bacterium]